MQFEIVNEKKEKNSPIFHLNVSVSYYTQLGVAITWSLCEWMNEWIKWNEINWQKKQKQKSDYHYPCS